MLFALSSVPQGLPVHWLSQLEPIIERDYKPQGVISIRFVSVREMRRVNLIYRGKDAATDVLSFRLQDAQVPAFSGDSGHEQAFGEILMCAAVLKSHAREKGSTLVQEFQTMLIHGILHVMGFDHEKDSEALEMEKHERQLARQLKKNLGKR